MPGVRPAATMLRQRLLDRLGDGRRLRVAGKAHGLRQVRRADEEYVDAFDGEDVVDVAERGLVLELNAHERLGVGLCA